MKRTAIEIQIGELVMEGWQRRDAHLVIDAMSKELARLFETDGALTLLGRDASAELLEAVPVTDKSRSGVKALGVSLAASIYRSITE